MKRTRQVSAAEAEAWLRKNPDKYVTDRHEANWFAVGREFSCSGYIYDLLRDGWAPYTITEEIDEPDRFEQQRDELEKWMREKQLAALSFETGPIYKIIREREEEVRHVESENDRLLIRNQYLHSELEKLKSEKRKSYQWKNCAESMAKSYRWSPLRPIGARWASALAFRQDNNEWKISSGTVVVSLPDPENWEFLELED